MNLDNKTTYKYYNAVKRVLDIVISALLLVFMAIPMLIIAIIIHLEDKGPVLYKQIRCTENMREFEILKFRSMDVDAEGDNGAQLAVEDDPRITKIGKIIRRTRLDELPQLFNILQGDMSLVGPRPERPELIEEISKTVPDFKLRNHVKAGLTGYAQVKGGYYTPFDEKLDMDLEYIKRRSIWLDIKIMFMTVPAVFRKP